MGDLPTLRVNEVFYSLQGEGARAGEPSVFVRLAGCSAKHACYASGVRCDTEFESGREVAVEALLDEVRQVGGGCPWVIWTGGEPLDQLTAEVAGTFRRAGFKQALETSGVRALPEPLHDALDYVVVSPKVAEHVLAKHFTRGVDEVRYVRAVGQAIPDPMVEAVTYYLSPHSDGEVVNRENVSHCIRLCLAHPRWRLSVQQHKLWRVR